MNYERLGKGCCCHKQTDFSQLLSHCMLVSVPPHVSVSLVVHRLKGKTSRKPLSEYRKLAREVWGRHLWACGYFAASSGNVTDDFIAQYIEMQDQMELGRDKIFLIGDQD